MTAMSLRVSASAMILLMSTPGLAATRADCYTALESAGAWGPRLGLSDGRYLLGDYAEPGAGFYIVGDADIRKVAVPTEHQNSWHLIRVNGEPSFDVNLMVKKKYLTYSDYRRDQMPTFTEDQIK